MQMQNTNVDRVGVTVNGFDRSKFEEGRGERTRFPRTRLWGTTQPGPVDDDGEPLGIVHFGQPSELGPKPLT